MGSYVSTAEIFHLPLRNGRIVPGNLGICFDKDATDEEIINKLATSNIKQIQTIPIPPNEELHVLNEVFALNPEITYRHYDSIFGFAIKQIDVSYLSALTNLKSLFLDISCEIINPEVIQELKLNQLAIHCFQHKDFNFLKVAPKTIQSFAIMMETKNSRVDLNDILHLTELRSLQIRNIKKGINKISEFKNLKSLSLRSIDIKDYSFLKDMNVTKIYLSFQKSEYFNTFGINETIEEVSLWRNRDLTDLSFLLQFPNLKKIIISDQKKVETIPDLTGLTKLEEIYFLERDAEEIRKYCNPNVKVHSYYNPVDIS